MRYDRTKRGWHVVIEWDRAFPPVALVALQAILGSDSRREALNFMRALSLDGCRDRQCFLRFNLLFSHKVKL